MTTTEYRELPIGALTADPTNIRRDVGDVTELAASIEAQGVVEPLVVCWAGDDGYVVVAGHRRLEAARKAGIDTVPCIVRELDDRERLELQIVENLQRSNLDPLEEADAFSRLVALGVKQRALAERIGRSQSHVSKRLALLKLPDVAREAVVSGGITMDDAVRLAAMPASKVAPLFKKGVPKRWDLDGAIRDFEHDEKRKAITKKLEAAGVTLLGKEPGPAHKHRLCPDERDPSENYGLCIRASDHAAEPCHVAVLTYGLEPVYWCTEPERHAPTGDSPVKEVARKAQQPRMAGGGQQPARTPEDDERARELERQAAEIIDAAEARTKLAGELAARSKPPAHWELFVARVLPWIGELDPAFALPLLGDTASYDWNTAPPALSEIAEQHATRAIYAVALGNALAWTRGGHHPHRWDDDGQRQAGLALILHLEQHGYQRCDIERWLLGEDEEGGDGED